MTDYAIKVEGLSKRYRIADTQEKKSYRSLREDLVEGAQNIFRGASKRHDFWALKDVSFEVKPGEVVGVIGRNGAGKSTLLKILSRITDPTEGRVHLKGRVGSLLEVGTGFHPELTGRENIYLSGTVLGMTRAEIKRKFDEIVDFAGIEEFLDTPVKRYSSGMSVRLGFAVAAHLEPEILIIDEVLAVGDAEFQKRCLGKMGEVAESGRTVFFVSHNMGAVTRLCASAILIAAGQVVTLGPTSQVVNQYASSGRHEELSMSLVDAKRFRFSNFKFANVRISSSQQGDRASLSCSRPARFELDLVSNDQMPKRNVRVTIQVSDQSGSPVAVLDTKIACENFLELTPPCTVCCDAQSLNFTPGNYIASLYLVVNGIQSDVMLDAFSFTVEADAFFPSGLLPDRTKHGPVLISQNWHVIGK
ncbi:ABC transporter ATP-binding protein [Stratiformator vulcanicus]|uniref:Teichoic acids export ATP-binding protein TagH n=1 Tax=Stratiformator vulcanicus TaxID=2527980 RepID=A0A517QVZ9_9PLAN|nr:polysaccharide ABC transporter ATP-binding protein [Stratiformator vulcanicus]QDT35774.1 Teichoic acids export ATP-binding protein TagH [Stratiformator vulcanicus]